MKTPRTILMALVLLSFLISSQVLAGKISDEAGFVDLDWIKIPDSASEVQDIDLSAILMSVASDAKDNGDEELAQVLEMVRSIRVKGYSVDDESAGEASKAVEKITKHLKDNDWKRLIYLKDDDEVVSISTKYDGSDLVGLMAVVFKPGEEVMFANVVGDLDLPVLMKLVGSMDGDGLDDLLDELEDVEIHVEKN
jgi:hypothetical protein